MVVGREGGLCDTALSPPELICSSRRRFNVSFSRCEAQSEDEYSSVDLNF